MVTVFCGFSACQYNDDGECAKNNINIVFPDGICGDYEAINPEDFEEDCETDE